MTPKEIDDKLVIPEEDKVTSIKILEAEYIYNFIKEHDIKKTLETGFGYARSASNIIAASECKHIVIDPFQANYQYLGLKNIEKIGLQNLLDFRNDYSHNILPELLEKKQLFKFIFIDGDHKFDGILIDFYYSDLLLENKGYILLHDTWMRSTQLVMSFIKKNRNDYIKLKTPLRNFALYQKVGLDKRNGMYFKEFYTTKSLITYNVITWLTTGNQNILKRIVFKLKELIK
ncbi:MAG: class I SAM-dependent methyltransferase [Cytophagales bacterium]|nr:class I SAM-dependent methyltransferase [Cytophagales bacterium]